MKSIVKTLVIGTIPVLAAGVMADGPAAQPATQPATRPAQVAVQSDAPLVIPDGTSRENPGPGVLLLQGNNTYTGQTIVTMGHRL